MTVARRLTALEASLTPTERILVWLDEAHAFGDLGSYVGSLLDQPPEAFPLNRLAREAATTARTAVRGKPATMVDPAVRRALRETVFRFELVMRINLVGHEILDREALVDAVVAGQLALLASEDREERLTDQGHLGRLATLRDVTVSRVADLLAADEARVIAEQRYLDGRAALFPDDVRAWAERLRLAQELAAMTESLADLDGVPLAASLAADARAATVTALVADLIEPSRAMALEKLDEDRRAFTIATAWLRSKVQSSRADVTGDSAPEGPTL